MNRTRLTLLALGLLASVCALNSCLKESDDAWELRWPTALVTVRPLDGGDSFVLQLDNTTVLRPTNMTASPYGGREVRALVNYTKESPGGTAALPVRINWIDSIRTKLPVPTLGEANDTAFGNDPLEIVRDWVTIAEDGYLTLRIRTRWGVVGTVHHLNLLTGTNPDNPYELELRHDARGDVYGELGDALIAFNLNGLPPMDDGSDLRIKLNWESYSGEKSVEFDLCLRPDEPVDYGTLSRAYNRYVK